jgi:hypothetical protein
MGIKKKQSELPATVIKIKAYPINLQIIREDGTPPIQALIRRMNTVGLQIETTKLFLKVGEDVKVSFTIPVNGEPVGELMRVIKTTDLYKDLKTGGKLYITELHFKNLNTQHNKVIKEFMFAIDQKN